MKFTIITRYYHPTPDGIAHHSAYLHHYLTQAGHQVQVIYDDGIVGLHPNEVGVLVNKIKRQKADWVIFQYNGYSYNRFGAPSWLTKFYRRIRHAQDTRLCLIVHETYIREESSLKLKIYRFLQKRTLKRVSKYADLILTTTHLYKSQLKAFHRKAHLAFTPSNFEDFIKELEPEVKTDGQLILGTFGNRDPEFLLNVLTHLDHLGLDCEFLFIGNYQPQYIKLIKEYTKKLKHIKISRSGKLTDRNIVKFLYKLDAFILLEPVREDMGGGLNTKSGSSATALCMGIPIFSTKGDFTDENVFKTDINYIQLYPENEVKSAEIIFNNVNEQDKLRQIGAAGKQLYEQEFSWPHYTSKILRLMEERNEK